MAGKGKIHLPIAAAIVVICLAGWIALLYVQKAQKEKGWEYEFLTRYHAALNELIHFVWFYVWNRLFGDSYDEYERPSLKWILSEMVVEPVMKDERLSSINPYFPRENGGCIYPCFFDMKVDGKLILDTLDAMYKSQSIKDFMRNSYAYCKEHEAVIREHIQRADV